MAKRKAPSSTNEDNNIEDDATRPKIKRTRSSGRVNNSSESQLESSASQGDSEITGMDGETEGGSSFDCSQMPDFHVQSEAEVGIIEKVTLQNFMCHKYLDVNFGPNVNFIIGKNGSGKSAIMTGLIVGLGGKAATTSRGSSLKGFIKDDCHSAVIIVKLRNRGLDAYMPEEYGNSIIIERRITQDGSGSYKLKSHEGKVISVKKEDLITILDQFNIQIDNPVSILNQDTSRCFLNSSDPKDKYKFFLKATQLEQMSNHYQIILEQKQNIKDILDKKKEILPDMETHVKELEEKYKDIAQLEEIREKVKLLKKELVWAHVRDKRNGLEEAKSNVIKQESRLPRIDAKIEERKVLLQDLQKQHSDKELEIKEHVDGANELTESKRESNKVLKKMKQDLRLDQEKVRKKERDLTISNKERSQLADRIAELRQTAQRDYEAERQGRQEALDERKQNRQQIEAQLQMSIHMKNQLEMSIKKTQDQGYKMRQEETQTRRSYEQTETRITQLQESQQNKLNIFGSWAPNVVNKINALAKQGKFHRTPIGPLGAHISLRKEKWNVAVEKCLGNRLMLSFCCHDLHDKDILMPILNQYCRAQEPPVIISRFQDKIYDVSQKRSRSEFSAVLDMLEIRNPVVANTLIDQGRIESVLLIEKADDAKTEIWNVKPFGASRAFTIRGDEVIGGRTQKYYSNKDTRVRFLSSSVERDIRQCREELATLEKSLLQCREKKSEMDKQIRESQAELQKVKRKCNTEQGQINKLNLEIQELESFEEEAPPDLTALEEDLQQYEVRIEELQTEISTDNTELAIQKEAVDKQQLQDNEVTKKLEELAQLIEPLNDGLNHLGQEIVQAKSDRKYYENMKSEMVKKIEAVAKTAADLEEEFKTILEQAQGYSEEVVSKRTVTNLESEISKIENRVQREERSRGNAEDITRKYHEAFSKYKEVCSRFKSFKKFHRMLDKVIMRRARQFDNFRRYIVSRAKSYFTMTLSQRGYSGKLKIDHEQETLSIQVNVQQTKGTATNDTRSLSGGERSFSTICFIMALWEAMESPFRVLDEFDVFMDMVNRRISMNMLLKIAEEQYNRQFVLLTPQDMSNVAAGNKVRIYRMRDPERGQTILPFQPVSQN